MADPNQAVNDGRVHKTIYIAITKFDGQPTVAGEIRLVRPKVGPERTCELWIGGRRFAYKEAASEPEALREIEEMRTEAHRLLDANPVTKGLRFKPYRVEDPI